MAAEVSATGVAVTESGRRRLGFLLAGPVLVTRRGCWSRVRSVSLGDVWLLCWFFGCDVEAVADRLWQFRKERT